MANYLSIQKDIINVIKTKTSNKIVDELAETLNISSDSAYRRIRLEKVFTLDELIKIATKFHISLDELLIGKNSDSVIFSFPFKTSQFDLEEYFQKILDHLLKIKNGNGILYYSAKDIPIFHFFQNQKLLAFKFHYWLNTMNNSKDIVKGKFNYDFVPAKLAELTKQIYTAYSQINTHEIWNYETLTRTSTQVTYYYELGILTYEQAQDLQNTLIEFTNHLEDQCALGRKYFMNSKPFTKEDNYHFYCNEILAADNSIYAEYSGKKESFLPHIVLNYMATDNEEYSSFNKTIFDNVINKSTLVSKVNEKDRMRFFNFNRKFISKQLQKIELI